MKEITIEELAFFLKQAQDDDRPKPIFFLGAGASVTGGIPLAETITEDILREHKHNPFIAKLKEEDRTYANLMECLQPYKRNQLLKGYIDKGKINVTHIYLAQLLKEEYVDYVMTVNFDNLMLRALALYNEFPPTYDMAILKDLTTTTFKKGSVVYLHGQHHGLWLLNTKEEMDKVSNILTRIFDGLKNERPWIFIGYSGTDPVFEHIKNMGRFDNGLYWVGYKEDDPYDNVKDFLKDPNTNAYSIKGYDADAFMLKLNEALGLDQPVILENPFTALKDMLNEIKDIEDEDHFKSVKERLEMAKKNVDQAIRQYDFGEEVEFDKEEAKVKQLKKKIIELIISADYDKDRIEKLESQAQVLNDDGVNDNLSVLLNNWGNNLGKVANLKSGEEVEKLYQQTFEKYQRATDIYTRNHHAYYNWGTALGKLAKLKTGEKAERLYQQAIEKYRKATDIKPDDHQAYYNWGVSLGDLADLKTGEEAEKLYQRSFEKYQKATDIKPDNHQAYYNWGTDLGNLADLKTGEEAEKLYLQATENFLKAIEIKPDRHEAYYNWGTALGKLAKLKTGQEAERLYLQSFEKYQKATDIKPDKHDAYYGWGTALGKLAEQKTGNDSEELLKEAIEKLQKAVDLGSSPYNLSCVYALLGEKQNALKYLEESLKRRDLSAEDVDQDDDWKDYRDDPDYKALLDKYR